MTGRFIFGSLLIMVSQLLLSQAMIEIHKDSFLMSNPYLQRAVSISGHGLTCSSFFNKSTGVEYASYGSLEFSVDIDNITINGRNVLDEFNLNASPVNSGSPGYRSLVLSFSGKSGTRMDSLVMELEYRIYNELPVIRKFLHFHNLSDRGFSLTSLDVENLKLVPQSTYLTNVYANYGTSLMRIPYRGDYYDPALLVYNENSEEGFILGNEAPSVLKKTNVYPVDEQITIGMRHLHEDYPFKKVLKAGESFRSPGAFICLYQGPGWQDAFEGHFSDFVRNYLDIQLFERQEYPLFYYCTWNPFRKEINEELIRELAASLSGTGVDVLILDDGWQDCRGDWNPHPEKFPHGLQETCKYIRYKGMKPGMWFTISTIDRESQIFAQHPEWAVQNVNGDPADLHSPGWDKLVTMSMASPWFDYILTKLSHYIFTCQLAYVKLDFAVANSAYIMDPALSGDYDFEGKDYSDRESSYWAIYEGTIRLLDSLHQRFPDLITDCTFEVWGRYNISDYSLIQHTDVSWLTNYEFDPPRGPVSIRQVIQERARVIPPATMLVGNQLLISDMHEFAYQSVASSVQLLCGDVRNIQPQQQDWYRKWTSWYRQMEEKYQYTRYYQKSDLGDKAGMSNWDACYKFNPERGGGVLFFYRNNSPDHMRIFRIHTVDRNKQYNVYDPGSGQLLGRFPGTELIDRGINISIDRINTPKVLGIEEADRPPTLH